ncbi:MAG: GNAT family N-acetyltransferase [Alphaproteobacteria bacterium]
MAVNAVVVRPARTADLDAVRALFVQYAQSLDFKLCFAGLDAELAALPGDYAPPAGRLLVAERAGGILGCVALRPVDGGCELRRLYVTPSARGAGAGQRLVEAALSGARDAGHARIELETIGVTMKAAQALYARLGFTCRDPAAAPGKVVRYVCALEDGS